MAWLANVQGGRQQEWCARSRALLFLLPVFGFSLGSVLDWIGPTLRCILWGLISRSSQTCYVLSAMDPNDSDKHMRGESGPRFF